MTTTPHPTDALPLPEPFAALSEDETPALYKRWADQLRAARREGYELAMSNTRERLAAIAEEFEAAIPTGAGLALAAMIREGVTSLGSHIGYAVRSLAAPAQQQAGAAEVSDEQIVTALESAGVEFQRFTGGLSGAQDIWTTAGSQRVKKIAAGVRAILALKAGGVA